MIMVFGEITTKTRIDYQRVIRAAIKDIGYDNSAKGFDYSTCNVLVAIEEQSPDIAQGLHYEQALEQLGAGDQGIMFGYATDETPELFPLTLQLAHKLNAAMAAARRDGSLPWLRPDTKAQVTVEYEHDNGAVVPIRVHTVVVSAQHSEDISTEQVRKEIKEKIIKKVIPAKYLNEETVYHVSSMGLGFQIFVPLTNARSNPLDFSSSVDLKETPVSQAERSLSTHTVDGVLMVVVPSLARTSPRSTDQPHTLPVGLQSHWFTPSLPAVPSSNSPMPLVLRNRFPSSSTRMVPLTEPLMSSSRSSTITSTCDQVLLSRSLTWPNLSTSRPQRMDTSPTRTSAGRSPRLLNFRRQ